MFSSCFLNRRKFPTISPLKQLVGCAEMGGMYTYKFILSQKAREIILQKFADVDRSLTTQRNFRTPKRLPAAFSLRLTRNIFMSMMFP